MLVLDKDDSSVEFVYNDKIDHVSHGTGDVFASAFVGSTLNGKSPAASAKIAGDFTKKLWKKQLTIRHMATESNSKE